jgi:hypothetical protein
MALDQQIRSAIEAATAQLAGQFQERLQTLASELGQSASAEHARELEEAVARVTSELTSRHDAALAALRTEAAEQRDLAVSMARTEGAERHEAAIEALRAELASQHTAALDAARAEADLRQEGALAELGTELSAQHEAAREALRAELASLHEADAAGLRAQLTAEHDAALAGSLAETARRHESEIAAIKSEADDRVARARAEADELLAHARAEADQRLAAARAEAEANAAEAIAAAKAEIQVSGRELVDARAAERQAELVFAERLSDAVRRLDSARSLIEVLDVLVDASAREVPRVAVFLVRGGKLAGWRAAGFSRDNDPRELEVPLDQAGLLTRAVRSSAAVTTSDAVSGDGGSTPFGALPAANAAVAIPLRVGGETVGVLYADDVSTREHEAPSVWPESVDVLARHACRCLEVVTITRVTQPISIPAPSSTTPAPRRFTPQARSFQAGHDDDDDAARRYARLLVSEIKLYHESAVTAGRRDRNLLERLRAEIDRARRLYGERVPAAVQARTDYFDQELVRTLASGDASLLGPA